MYTKLPMAGAVLTLLLAGCTKTVPAVSQVSAPPPPHAAAQDSTHAYDYNQTVLPSV